MPVISVTTSTTSVYSVGRGTTLEVGHGGVVTHATVHSGGKEIISSGGLGSASEILAGGKEIVLAGGSERDATVQNQGTLLVSSGGSVTDASVHDGGAEIISSGGSGTGSEILHGGHETVRAGGVETGAIVHGGGVETISSGGAVSDSDILHGGIEFVHSGGVASAKMVGGGTLVVSDGGDARHTTISDGGAETVKNGGTADGTTLLGRASLTLAAGATAIGGITFSGAGGTLTISGTAAPAATISGFAGGDTIDLAGITAAHATETVVGGNTLEVTRGGHSIDLVFASGTDLAHLTYGHDQHGDLEITCFYAGTRIRTPSGDVPVEALRPGDEVALAEGGRAPVRWIGRQTVPLRFADPLTAHPIRIHAGALGEALPDRDMLLSPSHAVLLDGVLVQAGALVNGTSVIREPAAALPETFAYYHVELERHALLLAEGVAAESFVDHVERVVFDNWAEHEAMFGDAPPIAEMPWPRIKAPRQLAEATRRKLAARVPTIMPQAEADAA